jgi:hypothetical protein
MKNQAFIILTPLNQTDLQDLLEKGWRVIQTCPMPSSSTYLGNDKAPTCLVVLEK